MSARYKHYSIYRSPSGRTITSKSKCRDCKTNRGLGWYVSLIFEKRPRAIILCHECAAKANV